MEHHTTNHTKPRKAFLTTENAVLISGVMVSLAILGHGVLARGTSSKQDGITIDKKLVKEILAKDVSHRYFESALTTEDFVFTEYSDTECPFCKSFHNNIEKIVRDGNGKYAWVYRHFPLSFHPKAQKQAEAIECTREISGDEMAFRYMDLMFAITPSNNKLPDEALYQMADALKISEKKLKACLESGKYTQNVKDQTSEGVSAGVQGTPYTFFDKRVNGTLTKVTEINGAQPPEIIQSILDSNK